MYIKGGYTGYTRKLDRRTQQNAVVQSKGDQTAKQTVYTTYSLRECDVCLCVVRVCWFLWVRMRVARGMLDACILWWWCCALRFCCMLNVERVFFCFVKITCALCYVLMDSLLELLYFDITYDLRFLRSTWRTNFAHESKRPPEKFTDNRRSDQLGQSRTKRNFYVVHVH